jgi:hypothetical protein
MSAWIHSHVSSNASNTASIKRFKKKKYKDREKYGNEDPSPSVTESDLSETSVSFFGDNGVHISDQFQLPKKPSKGFLKLILELIPQLDALLEETNPNMTLS